MQQQHNKKIFEKKSFFRWLSIGGLIFLLLFQFYSIHNTYNNISGIISQSIEEAFDKAVKEHRNYRIQGVQLNSTGKISIRFNDIRKDDNKDNQEEEEVLDLGTLNIDDAVYKANSYIISKSPIQIPKLDSIYNASLKNERFSITYDIVIYKKDSLYFATNRLPKNSSNLQHTEKKELDFETQVQAIYKNPVTIIFQQMIWYFIASVLLILIIGYALIYQLRMIVKQKQVEKMRKDFIDSMTHELRHPLQGALSMTEILQNPAFISSPERLYNATKRIKYNLLNLSELLDSIVQKSYSEKLQKYAQWQENNLKEMLNDLIANFMILTTDKEVKFITNFEHISSTYQYDSIHFPNAIKNIIDNAIKYANQCVEITVSVIDNDKEFNISIADNGIGISAKELPYIFDKFYRIFNEKKTHGFGLGLSYVKWVTEIHNGSVSVESQKGRGTIFRITIPKVTQIEK